MPLSRLTVNGLYRWPHQVHFSMNSRIGDPRSQIMMIQHIIAHASLPRSYRRSLFRSWWKPDSAGHKGWTRWMHVCEALSRSAWGLALQLLLSNILSCVDFQEKYSYAHRATNLKHWHTATQPYEIQYEWTFEPYILGLRGCMLNYLLHELLDCS